MKITYARRNKLAPITEKPLRIIAVKDQNFDVERSDGNHEEICLDRVEHAHPPVEFKNTSELGG